LLRESRGAECSDRPHSATWTQRAVKWTIFLSATGVVVYFRLLILGPFLDIIAWSSDLAIAFPSSPSPHRAEDAWRLWHTKTKLC
jgi:hypothetical protein